MKLADLRRLSIGQQFQIRFRLRNGMECVITEHGIAQVPGIAGPPDFNLEEELASANEFLLDPVLRPDVKTPLKPHTVRREELARLTSPSTAAGRAENEEE